MTSALVRMACIKTRASKMSNFGARQMHEAEEIDGDLPGIAQAHRGPGNTSVGWPEIDVKYRFVLQRGSGDKIEFIGHQNDGIHFTGPIMPSPVQTPKDSQEITFDLNPPKQAPRLSSRQDFLKFSDMLPCTGKITYKNQMISIFADYDCTQRCFMHLIIDEEGNDPETAHRYDLGAINAFSPMKKDALSLGHWVVDDKNRKWYFLQLSHEPKLYARRYEEEDGIPGVSRNELRRLGINEDLTSMSEEELRELKKEVKARKEEKEAAAKAAKEERKRMEKEKRVAEL